MAEGTGFARVMLGGSASVFMLFVINALRGAGDAAVAMRVLWFANALNIVLGPLFIFGPGPFPELGVTGAAVATTIGRSAGVVYAAYHLLKGAGHIAVHREHLKVSVLAMGRLARLCAVGTFQILISTAAWIGLIRIIATFGSTVVAGYGIAMRIVIFALLPAFGLSNAAATMVGQSLGAGNPDRAERSVWTASRYNLAFSGAWCSSRWHRGSWPRSPPSRRSPGWRPRPSESSRWVFRCMPSGWSCPSHSTERATPGPRPRSTCSCSGCSRFHSHTCWPTTALSYRGGFVAVTVAYCALALVSGWLFRRGRWKMKQV